MADYNHWSLNVILSEGDGFETPVRLKLRLADLHNLVVLLTASINEDGQEGREAPLILGELRERLTKAIPRGRLAWTADT